MQLTKKLVTRIVIAVIVLIVIGFVMWKFTGKSKYTVENIIAKTGEAETTLYDSLAACQNTFTTNTLGKLVVHSGISCTDSTVTVTSLLPHQYTVGTQIYVQGVSTDGTTTTTSTGYNTLLTTPVTVTGVSNNHAFAYNAIGGSCAGTITQNGYSWSAANNDTVSPLNDTRVACITGKVGDYMNAKCTYTTTNPTETDPNRQYYTTYQSDLALIVDAYANKILTAPDTATPTTASKSMLQTARQADYTGATRKYLNAVCPGYYAQTNSSDPGSTLVTGIPGSPYNGYQSSTSDTSGVVGFNPSLVTDENVLNWAKYASKTDANA